MGGNSAGRLGKSRGMARLRGLYWKALLASSYSRPTAFQDVPERPDDSPLFAAIRMQHGSSASRDVPGRTTTPSFFGGSFGRNLVRGGN